MDAHDRCPFLKYAWDNFASQSQADAAGLVPWLQRHRSQIEREAAILVGQEKVAAVDVLTLTKEGAAVSPETVVELRRDLGQIFHPPAQPESGATKGSAPSKETHTNKGLQFAQLLISIVGVIVGTSTGVWGRLRPGTSTPGAAVPVNVPASAGPTLTTILHVTQALVIFVFILLHRRWLGEVASRLSGAVPIARKTLHQFTAGWMSMWYGWLTLYIWFSIDAMISVNGPTSPRLEAVSDVLDTISGFAIWWCFLVLDLPSVNLANAPKRDKLFREAVFLVSIAGLACASLAVADRLFNFGYFGIALVGVYNGLAMASLAGRFGSHYIGTPRWMVVLLYLYAMLQIFYSFLPVLNITLWVPAVFILALVLKIVLALAGTNMMQNGGLLRYLDAAESGLFNVPQMNAEQWEALKRVAATS